MSYEDIVMEVMATLEFEGMELHLENLHLTETGPNLVLSTKGANSDE